MAKHGVFAPASLIAIVNDNNFVPLFLFDLGKQSIPSYDSTQIFFSSAKCLGHLPILATKYQPRLLPGNRNLGFLLPRPS